MGISEYLLFLILLIYALVNGWYVQRVLGKQRKYEKTLDNERAFSNHILETVSSGIMIINTEGRITYVNDSCKRIFNNDCCVDREFQTVFGLNNKELVSAFHKVKKGSRFHNLSLEYKNSLGSVKNLLIEAMPFEKEHMNTQVMFHIDDVTENIQLNQQIEKQYLNMFKSFVKFIDAKDTYTGLHSANVSEFVRIILEKLEIDAREKKDILIAANLHDIGKIGVPEFILNKPGKLTDNEFLKMKEHPVIGEALISEVDGYENVSNLIRHHHERFDGTGYPDKLVGFMIPLGSRIIAVADAFDAITTNRVYQEKRSIEKGIKILYDQKNKQFDGEIVDIFIKCIQ